MADLMTSNIRAVLCLVFLGIITLLQPGHVIGQSICSDIEGAQTIYEKITLNFRGSEAQQRQAVEKAKEFLSKYGGCSQHSETIQWTLSFLRRKGVAGVAPQVLEGFPSTTASRGGPSAPYVNKKFKVSFRIPEEADDKVINDSEIMYRAPGFEMSFVVIDQSKLIGNAMKDDAELVRLSRFFFDYLKERLKFVQVRGFQTSITQVAGRRALKFEASTSNSYFADVRSFGYLIPVPDHRRVYAFGFEMPAGESYQEWLGPAERSVNSFAIIE